MYSHLLDRKYTWPILTIIDFDISPCPILRIVKPRYLHHDVTIHQKGTGSKIIEGSIIWRWRDLADSRIRSLAPVFERSSEVPRIEFLGYRVKRSRNPLLHNQERARKLIEMEKPVPCTKAMVQLEKRLRGITRERERERKRKKKIFLAASLPRFSFLSVTASFLDRVWLVGWSVGITASRYDGHRKYEREKSVGRVRTEGMPRLLRDLQDFIAFPLCLLAVRCMLAVFCFAAKSIGYENSRCAPRYTLLPPFLAILSSRHASLLLRVIFTWTWKLKLAAVT